MTGMRNMAMPTRRKVAKTAPSGSGASHMLSADRKTTTNLPTMTKSAR